MTRYRLRRLHRAGLSLRARAAFILMLVFLFSMCIFCFIELRVTPLVTEAAKSRARIFASELVSDAVNASLSDSGALVRVSGGAEGVSSIETDIPAIASLRAKAVLLLTERMSNTDNMSFSVPLGNLVGSNIFAGHGIPIRIRLVPIGDITADIRTEFIESGINQTLHKITMRVRITVNIIAAGEMIKSELATDVTLAETVIVGKVPDAYTAINRFEIDEDEENDLNDYAATLP